jgi:hypothetical protein
MADWKVVRRLAIAITMAVAIGCGSTTNVSTAPTPIPAPHDKGVVIGGIIPCQAIIMRGGPQYAPGTVTVLKGKVSWRSTGPGTSVVVFPTTVVAQASVTTNGTYLFTLDPGDYVLQAHSRRQPTSLPLPRSQSTMASAYTSTSQTCASKPFELACAPMDRWRY